MGREDCVKTGRVEPTMEPGTPSCGCNPRTRQSKAYNRGIFYFKDHENEVSTAGPATQSWKTTLPMVLKALRTPGPSPPSAHSPSCPFVAPRTQSSVPGLVFRPYVSGAALLAFPGLCLFCRSYLAFSMYSHG